ncbi:MAG: helix-turn-helix domain-containing protein [Oscillochloris sp.]|nr:helix-turn-helix domain-containing protein [Oscillochloris sp.]
MTSPYITTNWVAGDTFYGRAELCQALVALEARGVYVVGTRRSGKTSLLRRATAQLAPHGVYCDLMQAAGMADGQTCLDEARVVRLLRRELGRLAPHSPQLAASRVAWDRPADLLGPWLEEAAWAWEEQQICVTLLWDEAEMLLRLPAASLMCLRALLQTCPGLRLVICAAKGLAALNDRWRDEGSPFLFGFRSYPLAPLDEDAADALIRQGGRVAALPEVALAIREAAGNHPYLLQLLCDRLYAAGALRRPSPADLLVDAGLADLFRIDVAQLSPGERAILLAAAAGPSELPQLARAAGLDEGSAQRLAHGMAQLGYLRVAGGRWRVGNRLLEQWLRGYPEPAASSVSDRASLELSGRLPGVDQLAPALAEPLSEREREVLRLIAAGMRNAEIADRLVVSENTVKAHVKSIYRKLDVGDRVQAINRGRACGIL